MSKPFEEIVFRPGKKLFVSDSPCCPPAQRKITVKKLPNILTLARIPCLFFIACFATLQNGWGATAAFYLFFVAGISDYLDGWLARKLGSTSNFGKLMDALTDKILTVGLLIFLLITPSGSAEAIASHAAKPVLPEFCAYFVIIILAREFMITGLRLVAASAGVVLAAERSGKIKTVLQLTSIGVLLFVHAAQTDWAWTVAPEAGGSFLGIGLGGWHLVGLWSFYGATLLTVTSGTGYLIKYRHLLFGEPAVSEK